MQFSSAVIMAIAAIAPSVFATPVAAPEAAVVENPMGAENPLAKRSFMDTCYNCHWKDDNRLTWTLECDCDNKAGQRPTTSINLNNCLANANGIMVWRRNGGAGGSCDPIDLGYSRGSLTFQAKCRPSPYAGTINLSERIHNQNGVLACDV
ncbi:Cyanovirin-N [Naviculisporaceae sp. PSN 640]